MNLARFKEKPFIAILRGIRGEHLAPLIEAVVASGWEALEITMNTPGAVELIQEAVRLARGRLALGAGTVLTLDQRNAALKAGATFVVLPTLEEPVVSACVMEKIPVFPGALTPQEIYRGWQAGASMVKVFPAKCFGPDYFKEIKGPFHEIELLACGGVTPENLKDYAKAGASAYAIGGSVFKSQWLEQNEYSKITQALNAYTSAFHELGSPNNL